MKSIIIIVCINQKQRSILKWDFNNTENEQSFNEAIETRRTIYNLEKQYLLVMKN